MKIFGGGNLGRVSELLAARRKSLTYGRVAIDSEERAIWSRCLSRRDMVI